jgi:hypothetical protein
MRERREIPHFSFLQAARRYLEIGLDRMILISNRYHCCKRDFYDEKEEDHSDIRASAQGAGVSGLS